ncbi:MAG: hypothetical protein GKR89_21955 [Candidatus Latescibacteria bacterium]|nr:hypothetical protein [Candidatus Latescibacterota bacterium]
MSHPLELSFLYYFSSPAAYVVEARIDGLPQDTPPGQVYHWLHVDRKAQQFHKLVFKGMGTEGDRHYRLFDQGQLWFDESGADLRLEAHGQISKLVFEVLPTDSITAEFTAQVQQFLQDLD